MFNFFFFFLCYLRLEVTGGCFQFESLVYYSDKLRTSRTLANFILINSYTYRETKAKL